MNHDESITLLLRVVSDRPSGGRPSAKERRQAEEHVAQCSDCWEVLSVLYAVATDERPPESDRMRALYGCEQIQDQLWLLEGLSARQVTEQFPDVARHLGWCSVCREHLVEILLVARADARGEYGPPVIAPASPRWKAIAGTVGETIRELVGRAVVQIQEGIVVFTAIPAGAVVLPVTATVTRGAERGEEQGKTPISGTCISFPLADSGLSAEMTVRPNGSERVSLEIQVAGAEEHEFSFQLRMIHNGQKKLLTSKSVRGARLVVFKDLAAGEYLLEIRERARKLRFQIPFTTKGGT